MERPLDDCGKRLKKVVPRGFKIRTIANDRDIERAAQLNTLAYGDEWEGENVRNICGHYPGMSLDDFFFVEEEATGKMVSSLCLIPVKYSYDGVVLKVAQVECVATLREYRRRGFIRTLMCRFEERVREGGYDLSVIDGIPYFYRQFGYEYALPLGNECVIRLDQIPDPEEEAPKNISIRPLTLEDIPKVSRLFEQSVSSLSIHVMRNEELWLYQERKKRHRFESFAVKSGGRMVGYFRLSKSGEAVSILEGSDLNYEGILSVLRYAKAIAKGLRVSVIKIRLPLSSSYVKVARYLGGQVRRPHRLIDRYIRISNVCQFLTRIRPVLERRIRASVFQGLTTTIKICLYREAIVLHFVRGYLQAVSVEPFYEQGVRYEVRFNPLAFYQLLVGYRSLEELSNQYPDVLIWNKMRALIDILFPKTTFFIHSTW